MSNTGTARIGTIARAAMLIAAILFVAAIPLLGVSNYILNIGVIALTFIILSSAFNLVFGYTGLLSLAQVGLWGIGAYSSALLVTRLGLTHWIAFFASAILSSLVAFIIGLPSLRLSRSAFIIVTLAFTLLMELLARDWVSVTRGPMGIPSLPAPAMEIFGQSLQFNSPRNYYYLMFVLALATTVVIYRVVTSRIGRGLIAIRENEVLAKAQGLDILQYKLFAFTLSAGITGLAGSIYVFYLRIVDPTIIGFYYLQALLIIVMVGGPGSFWGVILAAVFFSIVPELLRISNDLRLILFGFILVVVTLFLPEGIGGFIRARQRRKRLVSSTLQAYTERM